MSFSPYQRKSLRTALAACLALGGLAVGGSTTASAALYTPTGHECTLALVPTLFAGTALQDPEGYQFDTVSNATLVGQPSQYATFAAGGGLFALLGLTVDSPYDGWGDLFVGSTESRATQYLDSDVLGCSSEASGRQIAFKPVSLSGLTVQRKLFVSSGTGSGARLVQSLTNATTKPVTTNVYVGDMTSSLGKGTLDPLVHANPGLTSSGDDIIDAADRWAVTFDGYGGGDPALTHVWDGLGGAQRATVVKAGASGARSLDSGQPLDDEQFGYGWTGVTVPAGATVSFMSWELMRASYSPSGKAALARAAGEDLLTAPASTLFEGMTTDEIAAVRNWGKPTVHAAIAPVTAASTTADVTFRAADVDFGHGLAQCAGGDLSWDFGDGAHAAGETASHRFVAGPATVTLTANSACGGSATVTTHLDVAAAPVSPGGSGDTGGSSTGSGTGGTTPITGDAAPQPSAPGETSAPATGTTASSAPAALANASATGDDAPAADPTGSPLTLTTAPKLAASAISKSGVGVAVQSTVPGKLRLVLTGPKLKIVKEITLQPGMPRTPSLKVTGSAKAALKGIKTLQLRAKLTLAGGAEIITTRPITVTH
jgi:hypothetical protein